MTKRRSFTRAFKLEAGTKGDEGIKFYAPACSKDRQEIKGPAHERGTAAAPKVYFECARELRKLRIAKEVGGAKSHSCRDAPGCM